MANQGQHPQGRRDQSVAIGEPCGRVAVRVVNGIQQGRQPGDPDGIEHAPVQRGDRQHERDQPQQTVQVHQWRRVGPQHVVELVECDRDRPQEDEAKVLRRPPRHHSEVHELTVDLRITRDERERLGGPGHGLRMLEQRHAHGQVVELKAGPESRQGEQHHKTGRHDG